MTLIIDSDVAAELSIYGATAGAVSGIALLTEDLPAREGLLAGLRWVDDAAFTRTTSAFREELDSIGSWVEQWESVLDGIERDCE